jgi:CDP-diacylglycerol--serine O-phosphatidyltransferase
LLLGGIQHDLPAGGGFGRFSLKARANATETSIALALGSMLLAVDGHLQAAAAALLGCVIADGVDGPLARRLGVASPFGAQMDSLADMCAFGVAGPLLMGAWLKGVVPDLAVYPVMALLAICAAIRLARFNVSPKDGRYFSGVPTTLAAAVLALSVLLVPEPRFGALLIGGSLALFMVSGFPYPKLGQLAKLPVWIWLIPAAGALYDVRLTFLVLVWTYLGSGPLLWVHSRRVNELAARR